KWSRGFERSAIWIDGLPTNGRAPVRKQSTDIGLAFNAHLCAVASTDRRNTNTERLGRHLVESNSNCPPSALPCTATLLAISQPVIGRST
ncbi:MAG: hypothetical protein ABJK43_08865, partial [Lentilitoribacter sp.]